MAQNLPVALVSVFDDQLEDLLVSLGPEFCSTNPRTKLKINVALCANLPTNTTSTIWKRIETATKTVQSMTCAPLIIFAPGFYEGDPPADATLLEKLPPVVTCEKRLLGFARNSKIFWLGNAPVDHQLKIQCSLQGTSIIQLSSPNKFWEILPHDNIHFINNQPGLRIVLPLEGLQKDAMTDFLTTLRAKKLTIPVLLWAITNEPEQLTDEIWRDFNRLWCTSRTSVLLEYAKINVDLRWAPDLRFGRLWSPSWTGTVTIKDIVGRNITTALKGKVRPCDPFITFSADSQQFKTEAVKKEIHPRWSSLDFTSKVTANSNLVFHISDISGKPGIFEGRVEVSVASLLQEVSNRGVPFLLKTYPIYNKLKDASKPKPKGRKDLSSSAPNLSQSITKDIAGTLTITFILNSDVAPRRDHVPEFETLTYYDLFYNNTENFLIPFPTTTNLLTNFCGNDQEKIKKVLQFAGTTRSVIHSDVVGIIQKFLEVKKAHGSNREKQFYRGMTIESFVTRLATKRAMCFYLASDETLLRDGNRYRDWPKVGTDNEGHLQLTDYMSYDEILIAALYAVACPTFFINNGERRNCAKIGDPGSYEPEGVFVGLVGARFEHADKMESTLMFVTPTSTEANGFGAKGDLSKPRAKLLNVWANLYGIENKGTYYLPSWDDALADNESQKPEGDSRWKGLKYMKISDDRFLNIKAYKRRMRITIETFLFAAERYAREAKKSAYCHVIGLGLGAWGIPKFQTEQAEMIFEAYLEALTEWSFPSISDIDFSWFPSEVDNIGGVYNGGLLSVGGNNINIRISKRNPSDPINDPSKLLIAQYAWDGNSYPGNEYWLGAQFLGLSSDPAAACCSLIPQLQNPLINPSFVARPPIVVGAGAEAISSIAWKKPSLTSSQGVEILPEKIIPASPPISDDEYLSFADEDASARSRGKEFLNIKGTANANSILDQDISSSTESEEDTPEATSSMPVAATAPTPVATGTTPASLQELQAKMEAEMQAKLAAMQAAMEREMQARLNALLSTNNPNQPFQQYPMGGMPMSPGGTMGPGMGQMGMGPGGQMGPMGQMGPGMGMGPMGGMPMGPGGQMGPMGQMGPGMGMGQMGGMPMGPGFGNFGYPQWQGGPGGQGGRGGPQQWPQGGRGGPFPQGQTNNPQRGQQQNRTMKKPEATPNNESN